MKTKIVKAVQMIIMSVILTAIMLAGSISSVRFVFYMFLVMLAGFGGLALVSWYDDYFVGEDE